jgi:xylitol oxidase
VVTDLERQLAAFAPRPHWGKVFTTSPGEVRSGYERLPDFLALMHRLDPTAKFSNAYTDRNLGA